MPPVPLPSLLNGQPLPLADVPLFSLGEFQERIAERAVGPTRLATLFAQPNVHSQGPGLRLYAVLADAAARRLSPLAADLTTERFASLTPNCPQAHNFEREIAEQWGVVPEGHPWLKPLRYHHSYRPGHDAWGRTDAAEILPCVWEHFRVEGEEIHEVAVGPVHAGVIEPGSFRFQCHGEQVFHLEIHLGYQHRGVERALVGGPNLRTIHFMETLAGDTTIGHTTAYCQILEGLGRAEPSPRADAIRGIALELERLACHTGDLGALADDVGYLPTANYCGRLRGDFLNATGALCGSRFGRGLVRPGGARFDVDEALANKLIDRLRPALRDVGGAATLLWDSLSVQARFEGTGTVSKESAEVIGVVGMAARASGSERDVRHDFPAGIFRRAQIPVSHWPTGDVFARAYVRWLEIERSCTFVIDQLQSLQNGGIKVSVPPPAPQSICTALVEAWRGPVCHTAITDAAGRFAHYKVVDPSFHNWVGLMLALRDQQISDFPLCNKSFNLSYCGHDL